MATNSTRWQSRPQAVPCACISADIGKVNKNSASFGELKENPPHSLSKKTESSVALLSVFILFEFGFYILILLGAIGVATQHACPITSNFIALVVLTVNNDGIGTILAILGNLD